MDETNRKTLPVQLAKPLVPFSYQQHRHTHIPLVYTYRYMMESRMSRKTNTRNAQSSRTHKFKNTYTRLHQTLSAHMTFLADDHHLIGYSQEQNSSINTKKEKGYRKHGRHYLRRYIVPKEMSGISGANAYLLNLQHRRYVA